MNFNELGGGEPIIEGKNNKGHFVKGMHEENREW